MGLMVGAEILGRAGNIRVQNCEFRWNWLYGAYVTMGQNCTFQGNLTHDNCLVNYHCTNTTGGWPMGISGHLSDHIDFIRNTADNNHGEGIGCSQSSYVNFIGNTCIDNYSVNIYVANSHHVLVDGNLVYMQRYQEPSGNLTRSTPVGIGAADEDYGQGATLVDLTIINYMALKCSNGISYWKDLATSKMRNWRIANNTLSDSRLRGLSVYLDIDSDNTGNVIYNNIIKQSEGLVSEIWRGGDMKVDYNIFWHTGSEAPFS